MAVYDAAARCELGDTLTFGLTDQPVYGRPLARLR